MSSYKELDMECVVCLVTGNICLLVLSSPQMPKTIAICRPYALGYSAMSCAVHLRVPLLEFANQSTQMSSLNYIPTSCSHAKCLFLVTSPLNLAIIYYDISFKGVG